MNFDAKTVDLSQIDKKRIFKLIPFQANAITLLNYKKTLAIKIIEQQKSKLKDFGDSEQKF
ncbi:unnamed protein product [Paramecium sonneborni]|uniref:Uncharacterized protein n=1 Tax=Paramecium sonneborni TaxID=65129 RepID=A0A8S1L8T6_9CILI|nr:unnamed protein product [Paramecium sonneborni]